MLFESHDYITWDLSQACNYSKTTHKLYIDTHVVEENTHTKKTGLFVLKTGNNTAKLENDDHTVISVIRV